MGKKSKKSNKTSQRVTTHPIVATSVKCVKNALLDSSNEKLYFWYKEAAPLTKMFISKGMLMTKHKGIVTKQQVLDDPVGSREIMTEHLQGLPVGPWGILYQATAATQIVNKGGVEITFAQGVKSSQTFAYTCGFAFVRGSELFWRNVHESMSSVVTETFNYLYQRHIDGHGLDHGHTISFTNIACQVVRPDPSDATMIKLCKTLSPTRFFGLAHYDILEIVPVAVNSGKVTDQQLTRDEVLRISKEPDFSTKGFRSIHSKTTKVEACAYCCATADTKVSMVKLLKCSQCKATYYCSPECQRADWSVHKKKCKNFAALRQEASHKFLKPYLAAAGIEDNPSAIQAALNKKFHQEE